MHYQRQKNGFQKYNATYTKLILQINLHKIFYLFKLKVALKICLLITAFSLLQQSLPAQYTVKHRPKIGLVLSGGGAKGLAHIGVIKELTKLGIPVDYISGTSMGSIIGGLYACGYSAAQIENICHKVNWNEVLLDNISRKSLSIDQKEEDSKYISTFPVNNLKIAIPKGLVAGQNISELLSDLTWNYHQQTDFLKLPVPFECVATDIETMKPVVLKNGFLPDAIRASMAIPTVFTPIEIDNRLLADGGIVENFPVRCAKDMGADIIIGVNISSPLYSREQLTSIVQIMSQATNYLMSISVDSARKMCDYLIEPKLDKYTIFSFEKADSIISAGEKATIALIPELQSLLDTLKKYPDDNTTVPRYITCDSVYINEIRIDGLEKVSKNIVLGNFQIITPSWITLKALEQGIDRIYGSQFFERVNYKFESSGNGAVLVLRVKEQTKNFFRFSFNYDNNLKVGVLFNYTSLNIVGQGSRLLMDAKLGDSPAGIITYNIRTSLRPNIGFGLKLGFNQFQVNYFNSQGILISNFTSQHYLADMEFTTSFSNSNLFAAGCEGEILNISPLYASQDTIKLNVNFISLYGRLNIDNLDRTIYPTDGDRFYAELKYVVREDNLSGNLFSPSFWRFMLTYNKINSITDKFSILSSVNAGFLSNNNVHPAYYFYLGGMHPYETNIFYFSGLQFMEVSSSNVISLQLDLRFEPWTDKFITLKSNIATTSPTYNHIFALQKFYSGAGISGGIKTLIGPVDFTLSKGNISHGFVSELHMGYLF